MKQDNPTQQIINQRIRNRLIEYLEMVVDYQNNPPPFDTNEILNQWEDWVIMPCSIQSFEQPIFTLNEAQALCNVGLAWEAVCEIEDSSIIATVEWCHFDDTANIALQTLRVRGKFSEEIEEVFEH